MQWFSWSGTRREKLLVLLALLLVMTWLLFTGRQWMQQRSIDTLGEYQRLKREISSLETLLNSPSAQADPMVVEIPGSLGGSFSRDVIPSYLSRYPLTLVSLTSALDTHLSHWPPHLSAMRHQFHVQADGRTMEHFLHFLESMPGIMSVEHLALLRNGPNQWELRAGLSVLENQQLVWGLPPRSPQSASAGSEAGLLVEDESSISVEQRWIPVASAHFEGVLTIGSQKCALSGGVCYREGDWLPGGNWQVREIRVNSVLVAAEDGVSSAEYLTITIIGDSTEWGGTEM